MPPGGEDDHAVRRDLLSFEEASRVVRIFADAGVRRVRFTGGEPLVRKDVVKLVAAVRDHAPEVELVMTTNAGRLAGLARPLADAGLSGVNISIDTLDPTRFETWTRGGSLARVLEGIDAAIEVGFEVKTNTVALRSELDHYPELVRWAWGRGITPRFIELMPLGTAAGLGAEKVSVAEVEDALGPLLGPSVKADGVRGPASYRQAAEGAGRVGFITPLSNEFCSDCNRVRVTARGEIRACLADRRARSLRDIMRAGGSDADVRWSMEEALAGKDDGHGFLDPDASEHLNVGMSLIGG